MKKITWVLLLVLSLSIIISGCTNKDNVVEVEEVAEDVEQVEFTNDIYMVTADWLQENMEREDILVLDARGEEEHKKGHIKGALPVMWQAFSNMEGGPGQPNWGNVLDAEDLSAKLSEYGITKDKEIVVYTTSPNGWGEEGRIVWMLRRAGFENTKMLDGGYDYWSANGYEISKDEVMPVSASVEIETLNDNTNITTEELNNKINDVVIIDVRDKSEYEGATKYGEARGGHLPSAINITFNEFLNKDGTLKTANEIQSILDDNGVEKEDEIVTYCTAGIRSAHMQIVLDMMGYENVKNYDASFYAWAGNEDLTVEK
ncbi:MAG: rhodanese-like domain-containing protein [Gudongella sp.]|nr:rhodanese-like domain-containing protein [Gudongella sp.]